MVGEMTTQNVNGIRSAGFLSLTGPHPCNVQPSFVNSTVDSSGVFRYLSWDYTAQPFKDDRISYQELVIRFLWSALKRI